MAAPAALIAELDGAVKGGSPERCAEILRQVTNLFLAASAGLDDPQLSLFDGVFVPLIERVDAATLAHLSDVLSRTDVSPREAVRRLAFHDDAGIAAPVLARSTRLSEKDLVEIANTRSEPHLLALSGRASLNETLTDALIRRGHSDIFNALARNAGARFSESGYATLVGKAERDESLTEWLGLRLDIPAKLLRELLAMATDVVRARFLTATRPVTPPKAVGSASAPQKVSIVPAAEYARAHSEMAVINRAGKLNDSTVNRFAVRGEYVNVVAALALLSGVEVADIEPLIHSDRLYGLIVACKASRLDWATTRMIIHNRPGCAPPTRRELEQGLEVFEALPLSVAQWTIRFGADRIAAKHNESAGRPASAGSR